MAIGSSPEIGVVFGRWGEMDEEAKRRWFDLLRESRLHNIYDGYATIHYPKEVTGELLPLVPRITQ